MTENKHTARMQRKKQVIDEKIAEASAERGLLLVNTCLLYTSDAADE